MCIKINKVGKQEVGIWWVQKRFPRYGVPMWSLWPNIRFLPSIVAQKNVTKNVHICSMCIKTNKVGKQEAGIWWVQKRYPQYGIPIWCLWPNIRFLPSTATEKNATKNILDGRKDRRKDGRTDGRTDGQTDRGKTVYPPPPSGSGGINIISVCIDTFSSNIVGILYHLKGHYLPNRKFLLPIKTIRYDWCLNKTCFCNL